MMLPKFASNNCTILSV